MFITVFPFEWLDQFYLLARFITVLVAILLFSIFFVSGDLITLLIAVELLLLVVMVGAIVVAGFTGDPAGELFVLTVLVVGAAETAVALSIVTLFYQGGHMTSIDLIATVEAAVEGEKRGQNRDG